MEMLKWRYIRRSRVKVLAIVSVICIAVTLKNYLTPSHLDRTSNRPSTVLLEEYSEYDIVENILINGKTKKSNDNWKSQFDVSTEELIVNQSESATTMSLKKFVIGDVPKCGYNVS